MPNNLCLLGRKENQSLAQPWQLKSLVVRYKSGDGIMVPKDGHKVQVLLDAGWEPFAVINARPTVLHTRTREIWFRKEK